MFDIDHFKNINDTYGHDAGDTVLTAVAHKIREMAFGSDTVVRWGGEEFLVLRPSAPETDAWLWAERLRHEIEVMRVPIDGRSGDTISVTISAGLACMRADDLSESSISQADQALYLAKQRGRNRVCTWQMVCVDQTVKGLCMGKQDIEGNWKLFLDEVGQITGPTQREHLTTHSQLVGDVAMRIAKSLGPTRVDWRKVRMAGLLHDIGKCELPEDLLASPRKLTFEEWAIVGRHGEFGSRIAESLGACQEVRDMIRHHHTRYDASYEPNLPLDRVPFGARILCVADALVAMTSDRSYCVGRPIGEALAEIRREGGQQFDPDVVEAAHFIQPLAHAA